MGAWFRTERTNGETTMTLRLKTILAAAFAALSTCAALAANVVPEQRRSFAVACKEPGKMTHEYIPVFFPAGTEGAILSFEAKVDGVKKGAQSWFDARVMTKFIDREYKDRGNGPTVGGWSGTKDWFPVRLSVKVPAGAPGMALMPSLFNVQAGRLSIRNLSVEPCAKYEELPDERKARLERERQAKARFVPDEEENRAKWPKELRVSGNRLVDADGREVWLQGLNAGGLESVPNGDQVVKSVVVAIDGWKANCIRLPVNEAFWNGTGPYQGDGGVSYRACVDKIVRLAANRGAYVAIDLHRFRAPRAEHADFWRAVAKKYKNHPAVLFDLFNEPNNISWETWRNGGWVGEQGRHDESAFLSKEEKAKNRGFQSVGMQALVDAAREGGARNVVIASGMFWANDLTGIESEAIERGEKPSYRLSDPKGNGVVYEWHTYHWHPGWARILPVAAKHPVFLGEVGASPLGVITFIPDRDQEDPYAFSPNMIGFIQKHRINWTAWCFHPSAAPCVIKSWDYDPTPYWGDFVKRALKGERFEFRRMK